MLPRVVTSSTNSIQGNPCATSPRPGSRPAEVNTPNSACERPLHLAFAVTSVSVPAQTPEDCEWTAEERDGPSRRCLNSNSMVVRPLRLLSSHPRSMLRGGGRPATSQPASREGYAEGGGAGRREVSPPLERRETRASSVTAGRPPCQQAGLEADPAPGGSPPFVSGSQVRRGRAGRSWPAGSRLG